MRFVALLGKRSFGIPFFPFSTSTSSTSSSSSSSAQHKALVASVQELRRAAFEEKPVSDEQLGAIFARLRALPPSPHDARVCKDLTEIHLLTRRRLDPFIVERGLHAMAFLRTPGAGLQTLRLNPDRPDPNRPPFPISNELLASSGSTSVPLSTPSAAGESTKTPAGTTTPGTPQPMAFIRATGTQTTLLHPMLDRRLGPPSLQQQAEAVFAQCVALGSTPGAYNAAVAAFARACDPQGCQRALTAMKEKGFPASVDTFLPVIEMFASLQKPAAIKMVVEDMKNTYGIVIDQDVARRIANLSHRTRKEE